MSDNLRLGQGAVARARLAEVETVDEFLTLCDLDLWARERRERPTLGEILDEMDPDKNDYDPSDR